jgi:hypothetical protein
MLKTFEVIMLAYLFVIAAIGVRFLVISLMPHPWAFTPVAAALLFFGAKMPRKQFWAPLVMLAAADVVLTKFVYQYPLTADHFVTWAWYAAMLFLGTMLSQNANVLRLVGASLTASVSFFVVSNFAVWAVWAMYPKTLAGLTACYAAAVPFFRYTPLADMIFTIALFSAAAAIESMSHRPERTIA